MFDFTTTLVQFTVEGSFTNPRFFPATVRRPSDGKFLMVEVIRR